MTGSIISILAAAAGSVGAYFAWKSSAYRQRQLAEKQVEEEDRERGERRAEIEAAVYEKDDERVNEIVSGLMD